MLLLLGEVPSVLLRKWGASSRRGWGSGTGCSVAAGPSGGCGRGALGPALLQGASPPDRVDTLVPSGALDGLGTKGDPKDELARLGTKGIPSDELAGLGTKGVPKDELAGLGTKAVPKDAFAGLGTKGVPKAALHRLATKGVPKDALAG